MRICAKKLVIFSLSDEFGSFGRLSRHAYWSIGLVADILVSWCHLSIIAPALLEDIKVRQLRVLGQQELCIKQTAIPFAVVFECTLSQCFFTRVSDKDSYSVLKSLLRPVLC